LAHASKMALVTVEEAIDQDFIQDPIRAGASLPALYVAATCVAPGSARPLSFTGKHGSDTGWLLRYAKAAKSQAGFGEMLDELMVLHGFRQTATADAARGPR
jgi:glutaconate CoA-transferase, subunit A